ncbi:hypothetical protein CVD25_18550 [Bacillus canaveralius]|uniref:Uncharacterized protein n=1 Tax=Bacillus canaveralius TaxID=1403243 RepID=A0A2N5GI36_9BACI|nr:hypothetical protein CU635_17795 [Bacillus canaveralius]PLR92501.1 hypothetical protein CVD25_18550 [Bacillus canaveralius]
MLKKYKGWTRSDEQLLDLTSLIHKKTLKQFFSKPDCLLSLSIMQNEKTMRSLNKDKKCNLSRKLNLMMLCIGGFYFVCKVIFLI